MVRTPTQDAAGEDRREPDNRKHPGSAGRRAGELKKGKHGMLVLTRKYGEVIEIGDSITVTVLGVAGGYARLGIDAPNHIPITRPDAVNRTARVRETIDTTPRHTDDELDLMVAVVRGEPLHQVEQRHDQNDFESDMISAPRARAMARQVETLQRSIDYLRGENAEQLADINRLKNKIAELRALLQNGERVK